MLSMMEDIDEECSCMMITKEREEVVVSEDLIIEILLHLPPVSIIRFKRVCKSWYSLISDPDLLFLKHYHHHPQRLLDHHSDDIFLITTLEARKKKKRQQHKPPPPAAEYVHLLLQTDQNQAELQLKEFLDHALSVFIPQKFSSSSSPPRLIDSCNGLLLYRIGSNPIYGYGYSDGYSDGETTTQQYHVFNPITKQCFELPMPMVDHFGNNFRKGSISWIHIVFDPSVSLSFKVLICFVPDYNNMGQSGIYVYSSATSSWKYLTKIVPWNCVFHCRFRAVLLDGFLYLYICSHIELELLCFDVVKDKFWSLKLPQRGRDCNRLHMFHFGKCGGRLQLIRRSCNDRSYDQLILWPFTFYIMELELEVVHDQPKIRNWTVKHEHHACSIRTYEDHIPLTAQIIHIYKSGAGKKNGEDEDEDEALLFLNVRRNTVISYNLTSKTYGREQKISDFDHFHGLHVLTYTPNLFPFSC